MVDLRSDTVTQPTPAMRAAMMAAPLGTDVLGDDPTVNALEEMAARMTGKEAALYVPSGTMGNQIAIACHTRPGDAVIADENAHVLFYETGAPAIIAQVISFTIPTVTGILDPEEVRWRVKAETMNTPATSLLCLENTHNRGGGTTIPPGHLVAYREIANDSGMSIHLDGARIFNAAVARGATVKEICCRVDTVNFCLSKGLGCPIGSVLCGPADLIGRARRWRKRLGGGMCQVGLLAGAGIYALEHHVNRLADDHRRARRLWTELSELPGLRPMGTTPETNIVLLDTDAPAQAWCERLEAEEVRLFPFGPNRIRLVTHLDVDDDGVDQAIAAFGRVAATMRS